MNEIQIYKMKDKNEKFHIKKKNLFDIPFRLLVVGKSQLSGKSNFVANLLLQEDSRLYRDNFDGSNIFIWSPSLKTDYKIKTIIAELDIPKENLFTEFDENTIEAIYELTKDEFNEAVEEKEKPEKYTDILTSARENCSGAVFFSGTDRQLDSIADDHSVIDRKEFKKIYRKATEEPHSFMVVNYSNPIDSRYMDKNFNPIKFIKKR